MSMHSDIEGGTFGQEEGMLNEKKHTMPDYMMNIEHNFETLQVP